VFGVREKALFHEIEGRILEQFDISIFFDLHIFAQFHLQLLPPSPSPSFSLSPSLSFHREPLIALIFCLWINNIRSVTQVFMLESAFCYILLGYFGERVTVANVFNFCHIWPLPLLSNLI
jgi:hypothetical protein